jgi:hypothetical protein
MKSAYLIVGLSVLAWACESPASRPPPSPRGPGVSKAVATVRGIT